MADYRFSAQIIKRSEGKSSVASAAYRAAERLNDERTGEVHDYGRKGGVIHSEIMAPDGTPEWMHDRAQLWNAVEAVERRKDAQLAREVQLSLPHELTQEQRQELVLDFVQEQFVDLGMIADIAIHQPAQGGDERNHHAHVMLTMREITGDGFGKKNRDWNSPDLLTDWREDWALYQNLALERHNHEARVDHRSYEEQGIDREPTQHLGPTANDMEKKGKASRIGDENRARSERNELRAQWYAAEFALAQEIARRHTNFTKWREQKAREIENAGDLAKLDLAQKHDRLRTRLEQDHQQRHGTAKKTIQAELNAIDRKLEAKGVRKVLRDVFGRTRNDSTARESLAASLQSIKTREQEERQALERRLKLERKRENERHQARKDRAEESMRRRQEQMKAKNYLARKESMKSRPNFERKARPDPTQKYEQRPNIDRQKPAKPAFEQANDNRTVQKSATEARTEGKSGSKSPETAKATQSIVRPTQPKAEPIERLSMDDQKRISDVHLNDKGALARPWESSIARSSQGNQRPWESNLTRKGEGRERSAAEKPSGGKKTP